MFKPTARFLKKRNVIIIAAIALIVGVSLAWFYSRRNRGEAYETVIVKTSDVIQEVSVIGRVKPAESVELALERSGKVSRVLAAVGERVRIGTPIVALESEKLAAQLSEAEARLKAEKAKLEELRRGTRPEEIRVQEVKVENAKIALGEAKKNLLDKLVDAYTKSDDAVRNKADQIFSNPRGSNPQVTFFISDSEIETKLEQDRPKIEAILKSWQVTSSALTVASDLAGEVATARNNLETVKTFLDYAALAANSATPSSTLTQTTIDTWKSDISTARSNLNTAATNLSAAEEKLKTAESNLTLEENELALKKAGRTAGEITAQEARLEEAEANARNFRAQLAETVLTSPLDGIVTRQDAKIGEIVTADKTVVALISDDRFEIEANIPEADIAKIKVGQPAAITLDAYGDDIIFAARLVKVEPAETIIDGVATYKTTLQFVKEDERIKSGMTANLDIETARRERVIVIPQRAVIAKNGEKIARVFQGREVKERKVKTGVRGSDGNVEIIEGLKIGDKVIVFVKGE